MARQSIRIIFCILITTFGVVAVFFWQRSSVEEMSVEKKKEVMKEETVQVPLPEKESASPSIVDAPKKQSVGVVPFTSQAPFAEWNDPHFQNGCEEASLIMVRYWLLGEKLTPEIAKKEILAMEAFEEKKFGTYIDTSLADTQKILEEFYGVEHSRLERGITVEDIVESLKRESVIVVPADGRKLKNPHFTQPGPPRHMLVIVDYDQKTEEFVTHDPGTKSGEDYRYKKDVLFEAILDYPTGDHIPVKSTDKVMLVVSWNLS